MNVRYGVGLTLFLTASLVPRLASAGAFDVEGFGPEGVSSVNARAARASDGTASFYNPGGLAFGHGVHVDTYAMLGVSALSAQHSTIPLESPFGASFAFDATVPFTGALKDRIRFGFGSYLLPGSVAHLVAHAGDEPFYPYYDNRTQRLCFLPALAVRVFDWFGIGAAVNLLGGVGGAADLRNGASGAPESRIDVEATTTVALNLGVRFDVQRLRLALAYRQQFQAPATVKTLAEVGGVPLSVDVTAPSAFFDPHTFVFASSFDVGRATFEVDGIVALWSAYESPFVAVHAVIPGANLESEPPQKSSRNIASVRGAASYRFDLAERSRLILHGGAGYEPSMLKRYQQGRTNLLDGDKLLGGLGATLELDKLVAQRLRIGAGASTQIVLVPGQDKVACQRTPCAATTVVGPDAANPSAGITNPGYPRLEGGGAFLTFTLGVGVDL